MGLLAHTCLICNALLLLERVFLGMGTVSISLTANCIHTCRSYEPDVADVDAKRRCKVLHERIGICFGANTVHRTGIPVFLTPQHVGCHPASGVEGWMLGLGLRVRERESDRVRDRARESESMPGGVEGWVLELGGEGAGEQDGQSESESMSD
eukprot:1140512-Pelagomonas_calceolata.AAC.1